MIKDILNRLGIYTEDDIYDLEQRLHYQKHYSDKTINTLREQLERQRIRLVEVDKQESLHNFKFWLRSNVTPYVKRYKAHRVEVVNGHPFKLYSDQRCHKYLKCTNVSDYDAFCLDLLKHVKIDTPDELIFKLNLKLNKFLKPVEKYKTDKTVWNVDEYWESSQELFHILVVEEEGLDCDSIAFFKYHCFNTMLNMFFGIESSWRLRIFIVDVLGVGKHAMLGWIKEGPNDWIPIESTLHPDQFERVWKNDMLLRNNYFYEILWSFDNKQEYRRI